MSYLRDPEPDLLCEGEDMESVSVRFSSSSSAGSVSLSPPQHSLKSSAAASLNAVNEKCHSVSHFVRIQFNSIEIFCSNYSFSSFHKPRKFFFRVKEFKCMLQFFLHIFLYFFIVTSDQAVKSDPSEKDLSVLSNLSDLSTLSRSGNSDVPLALC